jgi:MscS family membrane protein
MEKSRSFRRRTVAAACAIAVALLALGAAANAQVPAPAQGTGQGQPAPPKDTLGRDTPRGTLLGFMDAAGKGNNAAAVMYLNTDLHENAAADLAHQLYVVLNTRLPARLNELSDRPEGSLANPLKPNHDLVGTIETIDGPLEIVVERMDRAGAGPVWLFSRTTLDAIPNAFAELDRLSIDRYLPQFLARPRLGGIRLSAWLGLLLGVPLLYRLLGLAGVLVRPLFALLRRRSAWLNWSFSLWPGPIRLFVLAIVVRWVVSLLEVPLIERQFWSVVEATLATTAIAWLLLSLNAAGELYLRRQVPSSTIGEMTAMLRLARRAVDVLVIALALLVMLRVFGLDPTAALAGLGIGGIAVALAAQKTLENVVGGLSIVFDKVVRVGDTLKVGETIGTVDYVGLRSTRIRTLDRTIVSVPNGQIANVNIETLSARDKFRFYHIVGLAYGTTSAQMQAVLEGIRALLAAHAAIDQEVVRARFIRLGAFSLDIEVFAYVKAGGWDAFLTVQQELLLRVLEIVEQCGTSVAFPSQTLYLAETSGAAAGPGEARQAGSGVTRHLRSTSSTV